MKKHGEAASTEQVLSGQQQANEQLILSGLKTLERVDELEKRALDGEQRLERLATKHLAERKEVQNANHLATLGRLTASIAHELGTPLAVIKVRAQMIAAGEVPQDELTAEAAAILEQIERMTRMVSEVLQLARPQASAASMTSLDPKVLGHQAVSLLAPLTRHRNVKLAFVVDGSPARVLGDSSRLLQILSNLIINAAQAMANAGPVELRLGQRSARPPSGAEADFVTFDVTDHGAGISPEIRERLFEPFFTTKGEGGGTGLGLAVSQRIANEHGGFIGVTSKIDEGSCFTLHLPPAP